ncbi:MAG: DUF4142 domain-containing protein [Candidatus Eisenbacteria bacterium]|nr:DUF4142 domain-containing protein [Candidatus Eisenbacteria bacterium]
MSFSGARRVLVTLALGAAMSIAPSARAESPASSAANTAKLSDANIAAIVLAANTIDVKNGELAIARTRNKSVKEFAQLMVTDHTSVNAKATALATRLKLVPQPNQASRSLIASTDSTRNAMRKLSRSAFDRAYVNNEVAYHQAVLDMLDKTIVPAVENQELKDLLVAVRPAFVAHLEHAKMIQASLSSK